jgi:hypothetical protein
MAVENTVFSIAVSSLLHDIGKFAQRAGREEFYNAKDEGWFFLIVKMVELAIIMHCIHLVFLKSILLIVLNSKMIFENCD